MFNLGKNIKTLRTDHKYSQTELAKKLGVSQTSIAHYESGTRQPTIENLIQLSQLFNESIDQLVGNFKEPIQTDKKLLSNNEIINLIIKYMLDKKEKEVFDVFESILLPYFPLEEIFDDILRYVLYEIGSLWEQGIIHEADEHFSTNVIRKVLAHISYYNIRTIKNAKAVTFSISSDRHTVGIEMINTYLETIGINPLFLGTNIPTLGLDRVIQEYNPKYIFISITLDAYKNSLNHLLQFLEDTYKGRIKIAIGGQGVSQDDDFSAYKNVTVLKTIKDIKNLITY